VRAEAIRAIDHDIATGVWPDMTQHGAAADAWPQLSAKVLAADILVLAGPIWLGDNSSVTRRVIERLDSCSHLLNDAGQGTSPWIVSVRMISEGVDIRRLRTLVYATNIVTDLAFGTPARPNAGDLVTAQSPRGSAGRDAPSSIRGAGISATPEPDRASG
jgi:hypothetical protein